MVTAEPSHSPADPVAPIWPGLTVALGIAAAATAVAMGMAALPAPWSRIPLSPVVLALVAGLILSGVAARRRRWQPGLQLASGTLLKFAVALIGLRLGLAELSTLGLAALPLVALAIIAGLAIALGLARMAGLPSKLGALIAVGTAICGASAIAATAPGLRARPEETAYAIACVALFGLAATLLYPPLLQALIGSPESIGLILGAAVHDTAQVTGAALFHEQLFGVEGTLTAASVTKLMRNACMLAVIPLVVWKFAGPEQGAARPAFPLFILGFLALSVVRTGGDLLLPTDLLAWELFLSVAAQTSAFLFAAALAALGMSIRLRALRALGWRPAAVALVTALVLLALATAWVTVMAGPPR